MGSSHAKEDSQHTNLELWSTSQPAGQRVEDKLRWAEELIAEYQPIVKRLRKVQK